jgi:hypothetical protein
MPVEIPVPITFNPYKHHFRFLLNEIEVWRKQRLEETSKPLLKIGSNLIDFYLGELSVNEIVCETVDYFEKSGIRSRKVFRQWLNESKWRKILLSDNSEWLVKTGDSSERFIHIHPAKYSKLTIRVRGTTLKTVLALEISSIKIGQNTRKNLDAVNRVRLNQLNLSPIKSLKKTESGILHLWEMFQHQP